jgi:hypothetical protein
LTTIPVVVIPVINVVLIPIFPIVTGYGYLSETSGFGMVKTESTILPAGKINLPLESLTSMVS